MARDLVSEQPGPRDARAARDLGSGWTVLPWETPCPLPDRTLQKVLALMAIKSPDIALVQETHLSQLKSGKLMQDWVGEEQYEFAKLRTMRTKMVVGPIYAPNTNSANFLYTLSRLFVEFRHSRLVVGGDWNLALDPNIDQSL
ncbi:hypothetical protein NDU88_004277 [Pleurodeles waltl]|uniref:Endonuclease/exonuclease/phosphatase domain-containing protein n=1 Tax=Pleurodeles waltl TaxID=8319 RepID=A0AAV7V4Q8_PLEWA|nr:hypothetical protein NDU88_004277 [Pleurodeles waltl]